MLVETICSQLLSGFVMLIRWVMGWLVDIQSQNVTEDGQELELTCLDFFYDEDVNHRDKGVLVLKMKCYYYYSCCYCYCYCYYYYYYSCCCCCCCCCCCHYYYHYY